MDVNRSYLRSLVLSENFCTRKQYQNRLFGISFPSPTQKHDRHQASNGHLASVHNLRFVLDTDALRSIGGIFDARGLSGSCSGGRSRIKKNTAGPARTQTIGYLPKPKPDPKPDNPKPKPEQPKPIPSVPIVGVFPSKPWSWGSTITEWKVV